MSRTLRDQIAETVLDAEVSAGVRSVRIVRPTASDLAVADALLAAFRITFHDTPVAVRGSLLEAEEETK